MKTIKTESNFISWADIALLAALFGFELEQHALRRAVFVNKESAFAGVKPIRTIAVLTPTGWRASFS